MLNKDSKKTNRHKKANTHNENTRNREGNMETDNGMLKAVILK